MGVDQLPLQQPSLDFGGENCRNKMTKVATSTAGLGDAINWCPNYNGYNASSRSARARRDRTRIVGR